MIPGGCARDTAARTTRTGRAGPAGRTDRVGSRQRAGTASPAARLVPIDRRRAPRCPGTHPHLELLAGIGETLRAARRAQGRSITDAAAETRVRESYLVALEDEDFAALGGDVYVRGFIRLYARYLGIDGEALVAEYRANHERPEAVTAIPGADVDQYMSPLNRRLPGGRPLVIGVTALVVLAILWGVGRFVGGGDDDPSEQPSMPATAEGGGIVGLATEPVTVPEAQATTPTDAPTTATVTTDGATPLDTVVIEVIPQREVRLDVLQGQPPAHLTLPPGETRQITSDTSVVFQLSDATAAQVLVNGQPLPALGEDGVAVEVTCSVGQVECQVRDA